MQTQMYRHQNTAPLRFRNARVLSSRAQVKVQATQAVTGTRVVVRETGIYTVQGTSRKVNEDRGKVEVAQPTGKPGEAFCFVGCHDGHGGSAVAEWLEKNFSSIVANNWVASNPEQSMTDAFLAADSTLLKAKTGFLGLGERGVGGSKCGATSAVAMIYADPQNPGLTKLVAANIGDARTVLVSGGQATQLSFDHVPDEESERKRIERFNPNPRLPLVRYIGGTWRVGGLLALSRAFGDAYLKGSLQFEGIVAGSDGYSSGFGLIAEPHTQVRTLTEEDQWLVVASDGLFAEEERGGGGGLDNDMLVDILKEAGDVSCSRIAETLASTAVSVGSTDDVTVAVIRLGMA